MGAAPIDDGAIFVFLSDDIGKIVLHASQLQRWQKFPIRQLGQTILVARNTHEFFDITIPWRKVPVADWPIDGVSVPDGSTKVKIAPALSLTSPHDRLAPDLVPADPIKGPLLHIGMICVL